VSQKIRTIDRVLFSFRYHPLPALPFPSLAIVFRLFSSQARFFLSFSSTDPTPLMTLRNLFFRLSVVFVFHLSFSSPSFPRCNPLFSSSLPNDCVCFSDLSRASPCQESVWAWVTAFTSVSELSEISSFPPLGPSPGLVCFAMFIALVGLPYSGKETIAKWLEETLAFTRVYVNPVRLSFRITPEACLDPWLLPLPFSTRSLGPSSTPRAI
jgi:hypothetical protein